MSMSTQQDAFDEVNKLLSSTDLVRTKIVRENLVALQIHLETELQRTSDNSNNDQDNEEKVASNSRATCEPSKKWTPISKFAWDQGGDGRSKFVHIYVNADGIGAIKERVSCKFTSSSFDLQVVNLNGENLRLFKDNLEKDIDPSASKFRVKSDRIVLSLRKKEGQFGPELWTELVAKRQKKNTTKEDPTAGIMDMMKDLYDSGDDDMRRTIGEAMLKSRQEQPL